jgi:hypothetical protein
MMPFRPTQLASKMIFVREEGKRKKQKKKLAICTRTCASDPGFVSQRTMPSYRLGSGGKLIPAADHPA